MRYLFAFFCIVILSCTKQNDPISESVTGTFDATLKVTIDHSQQIDSTFAQVYVSNATITLYLSKQDALNEMNAEKSLATNSNGHVDFYKLSHPKYYVIIYHTLYGTHLDSVSTPANSIFDWHKQI